MGGAKLAARVAVILSVVMLVVAVIGLVVVWLLNVFVVDKYNAYGEVPVPGSGNVQLPAGEVTISFHTQVTGATGARLPVPRLEFSIDPPRGVPEPKLTERYGSTTIVNNDAHVQVWVVHVAAAGAYKITTGGHVSGVISPRVAFGHSSSYSSLVWVFVGLFDVGLISLKASLMWEARRRRVVPPVMAATPDAAQPNLSRVLDGP